MGNQNASEKNVNEKYVIGLDFGTDSVRALIVDVRDGKEIASYVSNYKRWNSGKYQDPNKNMFRHHPLDYIESMHEAIANALQNTPIKVKDNIIGIGVATTGSTPAPVDKDGVVLALKKNFSDNPNAMFVLWKDHTAIEEAELINKTAKSWKGTDFTKYCGGVYSSEWFFSKILHIIKEDKNVAQNAYSWVELADWIPALLTGNLNPHKLKRSRCAAGHKAMWHKEWNGLPPEEFLIAIDPILAGLRDRLYTDTYTSDNPAGRLSKDWAEKLGLNTNVNITVGAFDPHMGAVGAMISEGVLVKVLGTSSCDMAVGPKKEKEILIDGICGQVDGSVIPEMIGYEAGQSSFGDVYAWFKDVLSWPLLEVLPELDIVDKKTANLISNSTQAKIIKKIEKVAEKISPEETRLLALDWLNGRRTPYADQKLKGAIAGLSLGSTAPKIYRALVESTAFGSKAIIEKMKQCGLVINEITAIGGIPKKSPLVMQILSDVLNMPVKVAESSQAVALGAAIFAAVVGGYYKTVFEAQYKMASKFLMTYYPNNKRVQTYEKLYKLYFEFGKNIENLLRKL